MSDPTEHDDNAWRFRTKVAFGVFAIIAAFFVVAEHRAHLLPYLPLLLVAVCPLMHVFMHHGHGRHGGGSGSRVRNLPDDAEGALASKRESSRHIDTVQKHHSHHQHGGR